MRFTLMQVHFFSTIDQSVASFFYYERKTWNKWLMGTDRLAIPRQCW
ncbi:MAG: hypothetical protein BWY17_05106 [Deltaproteobacteria bacterium ADurb.Bin207]|nr:MAG: hypothetical protein BWY17_05106 [Deltaproteobacteria bacterium ADurb.Bin207]